jgi:hypothetical protein
VCDSKYSPALSDVQIGAEPYLAATTSSGLACTNCTGQVAACQTTFRGRLAEASLTDATRAASRACEAVSTLVAEID